MGTESLQLNAVQQAYGEHPVLHDFSLTLQAGSIGCLLGPSGCGKTTALRCIAGFESISGGEILINGEVVSNTERIVPPEQRQIGMVFQDYALFPHLNVAANIAFGLHQLPQAERISRVNELLDIVQLSEVARQYPHELSGGQQQRVALARALAPRPNLILLDEPFSNLDVSLRERLSLDIREILKGQGMTAVLVTHDQAEAFAIADQIGVINHGKLQQWDTAYNLYRHPVNRFVATFISQGVFLPGKIINEQQVDTELGVLRYRESAQCTQREKGCAVDVLLRPDDVVYDGANRLMATIVDKAFRGAVILYTLRLASGGKVLSVMPSHHNHDLGKQIGIKLAVGQVAIYS